MELLSESVWKFKNPCPDNGFLHVDPSALRSLIEQAHKFVLDDEIAAAVGNVSASRPSSLLSNTGFARAPFPVCWFEFDYGAVWGGHYIDALEPGRVHPARLGFLLQSDKGGDGGIADLFWRFPNGSIGGTPLSMVWSFSGTAETLTAISVLGLVCNVGIIPGSLQMVWTPAACTKDPAEQKLCDHFRLVPSMLYHKLWNNIKLKDRAGVLSHKDYEQATGHWLHDWDSEASHLIAILSFLNVQNSIELVEVDRSVDSLRRTRKGKSPLHSHKILKLKLTKQQIQRAQAAGISDRAEMRYHLVRGHFKNRKTGRFWWSSFGRGDPHAGSVSKDYEVLK